MVERQLPKLNTRVRFPSPAPLFVLLIMKRSLAFALAGLRQGRNLFGVRGALDKNDNMANITLRGVPVTTVGELPAIGSQAPTFDLVGSDLGSVTPDQFSGKRIVLSIFPSLDTGVCATSVRKFNQRATELDNTVVITVSKDLPFAMNRFCENEGIDKVVSASAFRSSFGEDYGVTMIEGGLKGLLSRAVVVLDENGKVVYTQQVPEIGTEPDYDAAIASLG